MSIYKMNFFGPVSFLERQWHQRLVQICVFAALLFFLLGSYDLIDQIQKMLRKVGLKFGKDSTRVVNAVLFGLLLFLLTRFVMDPVIKRMANGTVVEGQTNSNQMVSILKKRCEDSNDPTGPECKRYKAAQIIMAKLVKAGKTEDTSEAGRAKLFEEEMAEAAAAEDFAATMAEEAAYESRMGELSELQAALDAAGAEYEQKTTQVETDALFKQEKAESAAANTMFTGGSDKKQCIPFCLDLKNTPANAPVKCSDKLSMGKTIMAKCYKNGELMCDGKPFKCP